MSFDTRCKWHKSCGADLCHGEGVCAGFEKCDSLELQGQNDVLPLMIENRKLKEENKKMEKELLKYKAKEVKNKKVLDFVLCVRKNGTRFIKIIFYSHYHDGWGEVARINLSKNEWVQDNFSVQEIFEELKG